MITIKAAFTDKNTMLGLLGARGRERDAADRVRLHRNPNRIPGGGDRVRGEKAGRGRAGRGRAGGHCGGGRGD